MDQVMTVERRAELLRENVHHWSHTGTPEINAECPRCLVESLLADHARLVAEMRRLTREARAMLTAVTFVGQPTNYGSEMDPNWCFKARVPAAFVDGLRNTLAAAEALLCRDPALRPVESQELHARQDEVREARGWREPRT